MAGVSVPGTSTNKSPDSTMPNQLPTSPFFTMVVWMVVSDETDARRAASASTLVWVLRSFATLSCVAAFL